MAGGGGHGAERGPKTDEPVGGAGLVFTYQDSQGNGTAPEPPETV